MLKFFLGHLCTKVRPYNAICNYRIGKRPLYHRLVEARYHLVSVGNVT